MVRELYVPAVVVASPNRHTTALALALALSLSVIKPARAEAAQPTLEAPGIAGCPSALELRRGIAAQLGHDVFDAPDAPSLTVRINEENDGLVAEVILTPSNRESRTRRIDGGVGDCAALVRAAALSVALALEAEAPRAAAATPAVEPPASPRGALESARRAHESVPPRVDMRSDHVVLIASGIATLGMLPRASSGAAASARVRVGEALWLSARGLHLPESRMPNDTFGLTLTAGGAGACLEPFGAGSVAASLCTHIIAGSLAVVGASVPLRNGGGTAFGAAVLSAGARARVAGPLTLEGAVEANVPFAHPTFLTETCPASGFQQPLAALTLGFGIGVSIP